MELEKGILLFLHFGWFLQNLEKGFIRTKIHTTIPIYKIRDYKHERYEVMVLFKWVNDNLMKLDEFGHSGQFLPFFSIKDLIRRRALTLKLVCFWDVFFRRNEVCLIKFSFKRISYES